MPFSIYLRRRQWHPTPGLLPEKSHGWRSLEGCSPWGRWGSGTTEQLHFHSSLSCIGEGNGNPLKCSCLENPRDGGAWWAAVYGVAQSRTRLKRLSSSSNQVCYCSQTPWGWRKETVVQTTFLSKNKWRNSSSTLTWKYCPFLMFLIPLLQAEWSYMCGLISRLSALSRWSMWFCASTVLFQLL